MAMEEKESYTPAEVAEIAEAYHRIYTNQKDLTQRLDEYRLFVPQSVQKAISDLRDVEAAYYSKTPKQRKKIHGNWEKWFTGSERFKEFFRGLEVFKT